MSNMTEIMAKLLIIGNSDVGKTNLLLKFTANTFVLSHNATVGIDFKSRAIMVDGRKVRLQIWDTAGQERFKTITQTYYKGSQGIILAYGIDDPTSFNAMQTWLKHIKQHAPQNILIVVIGTKCDIKQQERKVSYEQGYKFAKQKGLKFYEVSAKKNINVEDLFEFIGKYVKNKIQKQTSAKTTVENIRQNVLKLKESQAKPMKNKSCKC